MPKHLELNCFVCERQFTLGDLRKVIGRTDLSRQCQLQRQCLKKKDILVPPDSRICLPCHREVFARIGENPILSSSSPSISETESQLVNSTIKKRYIVEIFRQKLPVEEELDKCIKLLENEIKLPLSVQEKKCLRDQFLKIKYHFSSKFVARGIARHWARFEQKESIWLDSYIRIPLSLQNSRVAPTEDESHEFMDLDDSLPGPSNRTGRPKKQWNELSLSTQRKQIAKTASILSKEPFIKSVKGLQQIAKHENPALSELLKEALKSPNRPAKLVSRVKDNVTMSQYTSDEALALMIDSEMTKKVYNDLRSGAISHGFPLYPPYSSILLAKARCRPEQEPIVDDVGIQVSLVSLLGHTFRRVVELQTEVLKQYAELTNKSEIICTMLCSWGFDSSTGHSQYKQRFSSTTESRDNSLLATTVIPLQIVVQNELKSDILWQNPTPQSVRYCRPLKLQFLKETEVVVLEEKAEVEKQIAELTQQSISISDNVKVTVNFKLFFTVIDGKVLNIVCGTSSMQVCPICQATPSQMNDLGRPFTPSVNNLIYGISPLHAWIRMLEFCLHLGYRNCEGLYCWRVQGSEKQIILATRKRAIQEAIKKEMALSVDMPKPGGSGTTNDGNTARRVFSDAYRKKFALILGIEDWLVEGLHTILVVISSGLPINPSEFGSYCKNLACRYVEKYPWYYMPSSLHRILIHGKDIISKSAVPVGMLSEQAGESCHKKYRQYREFHSRKTSRIDNLSDIFNRSLDASDPIVSNFSLDSRLKKLYKFPLPPSALALLQQPDPEDYTPRTLFPMATRDEGEEAPSELDFALTNTEIMPEDDLAVLEEVDAEIFLQRFR